MNRSITSPFESFLDKCEANYTPLSPLSFIQRTARVFPDKPAIVHGELRQSWGETYERCKRFSSALTNIGVGKGDTVAVMAPNVPMIFEAHFGVPMAGAILNTLNVHLDAQTLGFILNHGEAKVLITDTGFADVITRALQFVDHAITVIDYQDPTIEAKKGPGEHDYESWLNAAEPDNNWALPNDEWDAISLNYTSGTTGNPKGVVYHHRGAYLNASSNIIDWNMQKHPVYLWTLPMFHCNGWCFPWTLAANAGVSICMRAVSGANIFNAIAKHKVTHFCGAPIVLGMVVNATDDERKPFDHEVQVMTAAAPPPASVLQAMESQGFRMTHVYGLTETYGPAVICDWNSDWNALNDNDQALKKSRQGVPYHMLEGLEIMHPESMQIVAADGEQMGEAMFRGNIVMKGYLKNPKATEAAFAGGWFHSGDLGVMHEDKYIQLKDRSKDIIISGGENISSIEIEDALYRHPEILEAAVVARPDNKWGETPCAFVTLRANAETSEQAIIDFCRANIASYKIPKTVVFGELPKTSTGKVQKFKLREKTEALGSLN
ncbi:MAG: acyl-CoA synthetase [Arenicellales bacterium WSBS_2016_MAG_OTU3]